MSPNIFFNEAGRLRGLWRLAAFTVALIFALYLLGFLYLLFATAVRGAASPESLFSGWMGFIAQSAIFLAAAALVGWGCNYAFEELPWRALGWTFHSGWLRDALAGSLVGALSISLAALICLAYGSYSFTVASEAAPVVKTLASSAAFFTLAAAAEETLFRGYPLQTALRAWPAWLAVVPTSLLFAYVHTDNPYAVSGYTFLNTSIAGFWLAVAYVRTRSLWLPLGLHWGWNFTMGSLLGLPVSGISFLTPAPLLRTADTGPAWLTGGHYGIEGGAACTLALVISTIFVAYAPLFRPDAELKRMTDEENPLAFNDNVRSFEA